MSSHTLARPTNRERARHSDRRLLTRSIQNVELRSCLASPGHISCQRREAAATAAAASSLHVVQAAAAMAVAMALACRGMEVEVALVMAVRSKSPAHCKAQRRALRSRAPTISPTASESPCADTVCRPGARPARRALCRVAMRLGWASSGPHGGWRRV